MELNSKNLRKIILIVFLATVFLTVAINFLGLIGLLKRVIGFFSPVIAALCIAFVLNVLLRTFENKVFRFMDNSRKRFVIKLKRPICLVLTYLVAFGIISLLMLVIIPDIIDTVTYIAEKMPKFVSDAREWIEALLYRFNIEAKDIPELTIDWSSAAKVITDWLSGSSKKIFGDAVNITTSVFTGLFDTIFSFVISVYILAQKERIGRFVRRIIDNFVPQKRAKIIYHISFRAHDCFTRFIGGQVTESLILGVLCFIGMIIFRMPNALIISVLISVTSLVPIVGAFVGIAIGFLLIVISSPIKALLFLLFIIILQQIEGNLIYPKVVGKAVGLPGIIVVSAVMVGGNIGGVLGGLVAVPTSALVFVLVKEVLDWKENKKLKISEG